MQVKDWFIDVDTHVLEPADVWTSRLPEKWKDKGPVMRRNEDGVDAWHIGDTQAMIPVGHLACAGWHEPFPAAPKNFDETPKSAWDPHARLAYMDSVGIWAMALYPNVGGFGNQAFLELKDPALMLACVQAYNDFLTEWCAADTRRLIPIMATPFWDVAAAVDEIRRCAAMGHKGILFSGSPQALGFPYIGDPHWQPIWDVARDTGLPISLHIGSVNVEDEFPMGRIQAHGITATTATQTVGLFMKAAIEAVDLALSGVLPRNPGVKFVSVESGLGWVPFALEAIDHAFQNAQVRRERPEFERMPSEYFKEQIWACTFFEESGPGDAVDRFPADRVMMETDFPHPVCLCYDRVREKVDKAFGHLDEADRHQILWKTAADLYDVARPDQAWQV